MAIQRRPERPARQLPAPRIAITHFSGTGGNTRETRYSVNTQAVADLLNTGPTNLLIIGDSISSQAGQLRLPTFIALEWKPPNGFSGWYLPVNLTLGGALTNFAGTLGESGAWPFHSVSTATVTDFTVTTYADANLFDTSEVLTGVISPLGRSCRKFVNTGVWNFPIFSYAYMGAQGTCARGTVWADGDWITGNANLRIGLVNLSQSGNPTASMSIYTQEGAVNASAAAATSVVNAITLTQAATPEVHIAWTGTLAASSVNTPFGTVENSPGVDQMPLCFQYGGIGTIDPGEIMTSADIVAAGNADWTGAFLIRTVYNANSNPTGDTLVMYGVIIEDTANTTGLYVDNISMSGATIRTLMDGSTTAQMARDLNLHSGRPCNWVLMHIGENHTTAEWDGGAIDEALIRSDLEERIAFVNAGWDLAGIPRGLITLVSPWETVGGTKSGSAWYTTVATIMRAIAKENPSQVSFIDLRQMFADRFENSDMYDATTNAYMRPLQDGTHQSFIGGQLHARFIWQGIFGTPVNA